MTLTNEARSPVHRLVVGRAIQRLTPILQQKVYADKPFMSSFGWTPSLTLFEKYEVKADDFYSFLGRLESEEVVSDLMDRYGKAIPVSANYVDDVGVVVQHGEQKHHVVGAELLFRAVDFRTKAFDHIVSQNTLLPSGRKVWREKISEGALTTSEFSEFGEWLDASVERAEEGLQSEIDSNGGVRPDLVVPQYKAMLMTLVGERKSDSLQEFYVQERLDYCKEVLAKHLVRGLILIGPSCVLREQGLVDWICMLDPATLSDAFNQVLRRTSDPFTAALVLDVSHVLASRTPVFQDIADRARQRLEAGADSTELSDFAYALVSVMSEFKRQRVFTEHPLYYRRLAIWTWAGYVARRLNSYKFDRPQMLESLKERSLLWISFSGRSDRFSVPSWRPEWVELPYIRAVLICRRNVALGLDPRGVPLSDFAESNSEFEQMHPSLLLELLPGPFDELAAAEFSLEKMPSEFEQGVAEQIEKTPNLRLLASMLPAAQIFQMPEAIQAKVKALAVELAKAPPKSYRIEDVQPALATLTHLAGMWRDTELATSAIDLVRGLSEVSKVSLKIWEMYVILDAASAAGNDREKLRDLLRRGFERLALSEITASEAEACLRILDAVTECDPWVRPILGRARAIFRLASRNARESQSPDRAGVA